MKIEVGKRYRNRRGDVVKITGTWMHPIYPFCGYSLDYPDRRFAYTEGGVYCLDYQDSGDLIAPADDPVITYLQCPVFPKLPNFGDLCDAIANPKNWDCGEPRQPVHPIVEANVQSRDRALLGPDGRPSRMLTAEEVAFNEAREAVDFFAPNDGVGDSDIDERIRECRINKARWELGLQMFGPKKPNPGPYPPQRGCFGER